MKKKKVIIILIVSIGFICNLCIYHSTFAKYSNKVVENVNAQIANPIIVLEGEKSKEITLSSLESNFEFNVKNYYEDGQMNEANMDYYIEIVSKNLEKLQINLYKDDEEIQLTNYKTQPINLSNIEQQLDKYHMQVKFIGDLDTTVQEDVQIRVNCVQKD